MKLAVIGALALATLSMPATGQDSRKEAGLQWVQERLAQIKEETSNRSTADRAVRSYFLYLNYRSEISCLNSEVYYAYADRGDVSIAGTRDFGDGIRDGFFSGLPLASLNKFDRRQPFEECMAGRETYSYEIVGVEPVGNSRTKFTLVVKNTTPIPAGAQPDAYDLERRQSGTRLRLDFQLVGSEWKITQIEEGSTYSEEWTPQFNESDLKPLVPSLVPTYPY